MMMKMMMMSFIHVFSVSAVSWCVKSGILTWFSLGYSSLSCRLRANQPSVSPATSHHPPATAGRWVRLRPSRWQVIIALIELEQKSSDRKDGTRIHLACLNILTQMKNDHYNISVVRNQCLSHRPEEWGCQDQLQIIWFNLLLITF